MLKDSQLDLCGRVDFARTTPLLARDEAFSFACAGCGGCCRGREDIVLSGFDLWRIAARLRLPPQTVARAFCRASIGQVSHLPVLRLAPVKEERNNCPFLTEDHCAIHDAEPLVCALYPLAQEISREGEVSYFLQPTGCGGRVIEAKVEDYLARYDVPAREKTDVRWAQTCMDLEDVVEPLDAALEPPLRRRMQAKLWQALYFRFDYGRAYLPGVMKHHSLMLRGNLQHQNLASQNFFYKELFPRGAAYNIVATRLGAASADYQFPVWCPDGGISSIVYFSRIRLNVYYDFARFRQAIPSVIRTFYRMHTVTSYGGEIIFDMHPLRIPAKTTTVGFYIYKPSDRSGVVGGVKLSLPI